MDQRAVVSLESKQGDYTFSYHMPVGSTWDDAMKAASDIFNGLQELIKRLQEEEKAKAAAKSDVAIGEDTAANAEPIVPEIVEPKEA